MISDSIENELQRSSAGAIRNAALEEAAKVCDAEAKEWRDIENGCSIYDRAPKAARETADSCAAQIRALKKIA